MLFPREKSISNVDLSKSAMMESLKDTKAKHEVLEEVVAYVEVRSKSENRSKEVAIELEKLGARISPKLNNEVTHVIFKDGTKRTWDRAKKLGIPLVSVLWVDSCKRSLQHADEEAFFVSTPHNIAEAEISIFPKKRAKGFRCMQPKNLNEEFEDSSQRCRRRRKRSHKTNEQQNSSLSDVYFTPVSDFKQNVPRLTTPPRMKERLLEYSRSQDNTPICHRSFQKQIFNDGSDVENSSPSEDKEMLKTESFKLHNSDGSTQQDSLASASYLSINNQMSFVPTKSSDLTCLPNQLDVLNDTKQNPKAVSEIDQLDQNAKIKVSPDLPMKSSIYCSMMSSSLDVKSAENSSTDVSDVPEDVDVNVSSTVFKEADIFSNSPIENLSSSLLSSDCDTSLTSFKRSQRISRQKFAHRETMHVLGISDEDYVSSKTSSLSNANIPSYRTDDVGTNISSFTVNQEEVLINGNTQNSNTLSSLLSWKSVGSLDNSQESKAWEMEIEKEKQVRESQQTSSSCLDQSDTIISDDQTLGPRVKRRKLDFPTTVSLTTRNLRPVKKYLVMTSMSTSDQEMVKSVAKTLGECVISDIVKKSTTHVICGMPRRTLNVLFALSQGCWLVSKEWVSASMEAGCWLDENKFELVASYPVAQLYREQKQLNSGPKVFDECGSIYVSAVKAPPKKDLIQLLQLCGGKVKNTICNASIYIGEEYHPSMISVTPLWIFDSISSGTALPFDDYMLGQPKPPSPEY
ncbi:microcephalin [Octopus bimaculoides]|uniref:BRCT domain-containing protein n=1 Tax=Octopus bimaculoides TaxID=37653 RepID=A0A0L8GAN0_OCTBM|nr:microcephalin [Octopus bimaculoides]XP_014782753.1 microcephalin [Octopus bimaculoides]XP_014782754.1 microcephalin [Octopus bimaculoides]|eukprot:XP_014782751.1 PREDICTED: microcephalin-like [Octopus bimaculoides]